MRNALGFVLVAAVACGGGGTAEAPAKTATDVATAKPSGTADAAKGAAEAEKKKQEQALQEVTKGEAKSGQCESGHQAALEKAMAALEDAVRAKTGDDGKVIGFTTVDKRVNAFAENAKNVQIKVSGRGTEVHLLAFAPREISLDVEHEGRAATVRSPMASEMASKASDEHARFGKAAFQFDSRVVDVKAGETLQIMVRGQGCGILMAFMKP